MKVILKYKNNTLKDMHKIKMALLKIYGDRLQERIICKWYDPLFILNTHYIELILKDVE